MTKDEIKQMNPILRLAKYILLDAKLMEVGARLRVAHAHESTDYDEKWTPEEDAEWEEACSALDPWFYTLTEQDKAVIALIEPILGPLTRGEYPNLD